MVCGCVGVGVGAYRNTQTGWQYKAGNSVQKHCPIVQLAQVYADRVELSVCYFKIILHYLCVAAVNRRCMSCMDAYT